MRGSAVTVSIHIIMSIIIFSPATTRVTGENRKRKSLPFLKRKIFQPQETDKGHS